MRARSPQQITGKTGPQLAGQPNRHYWTADLMTNPDTSPNKGKDEYRIHLNFLSVEAGMSGCVVYRRKCDSPQERRPSPLASAHKLPVASADEKDWPSYWVLPEAAAGFDPFDFETTWNADIARRILFDCLKRSVESSLEPAQNHFPDNSFIQEVSLIMAKHPGRCSIARAGCRRSNVIMSYLRKVEMSY